MRHPPTTPQRLFQVLSDQIDLDLAFPVPKLPAMSNAVSDSPPFNPDSPAYPAVEQEAHRRRYSLARWPDHWAGACLSCRHLFAVCLADEAKQTYIDHDGQERPRVFGTWKRFCHRPPDESLELESDVAYCTGYEFNREMADRFAAMRGEPFNAEDCGNAPTP